MTQRVYKGSDLKLNIKLIDKNGIPYRVSEVSNFSIKFYTSDISSAIECTYGAETSGILQGVSVDSAILNSVDLDNLQRGLLRYTYHIQVENSSFQDGLYDEIVEGTTSIYLA